MGGRGGKGGGPVSNREIDLDALEAGNLPNGTGLNVPPFPGQMPPLPGKAGGGGGGGSSSGFGGKASAGTGGMTGTGGGGSGGSGSGGSTPISQQPLPGYTPSFNKQSVAIKPGTNHTPDRKQSDLVHTMPPAAVADSSAPLGSEDNPHVFAKADKQDWAKFGVMHTNQDKQAWDSEKAWKHAYKYTETTAPYNRLANGQDTEDTLGFDEAFKDSAVEEIEEWIILGSSQDGKFFTGANGMQITHPDTGDVLTFEAKDIKDPDDIYNHLRVLEGVEFVQTNYVSTAIPVDKTFNEFSNNVRVIFKVPPGSKGVYVSGNPRPPANWISYFQDSEMEMILPRHQKLRVLSVTPTSMVSTGSYGSGRYDVDVVVEVLEQPYV